MDVKWKETEVQPKCFQLITIIGSSWNIDLHEDYQVFSMYL